MRAARRHICGTTRNRHGEILWPGWRRWARPYRWPRPGCWRRSRCSRRCWRWRSAVYSGKNVHPAPSINVVWRSRIAAQGGSDMNSRVIQGIATRSNLMPHAWQRAPQQGHGPGDVRSGHGGAAGNRICVVSGVGARARACARSTDIRLYPVALIDRYRSAAAKARRWYRCP